MEYKSEMMLCLSGSSVAQGLIHSRKILDLGQKTRRRMRNQSPARKKKQERDLGIVATQGMWVFRKKGVTIVSSGSFGRGGGVGQILC